MLVFRSPHKSRRRSIGACPPSSAFRASSSADVGKCSIFPGNRNSYHLVAYSSPKSVRLTRSVLIARIARWESPGGVNSAWGRAIRHVGQIVPGRLSDPYRRIRMRQFPIRGDRFRKGNPSAEYRGLTPRGPNYELSAAQTYASAISKRRSRISRRRQIHRCVFSKGISSPEARATLPEKSRYCTRERPALAYFGLHFGVYIRRL